MGIVAGVYDIGDFFNMMKGSLAKEITYPSVFLKKM